MFYDNAIWSISARSLKLSGMLPIAPRSSRSCSGLEAPIITLDTFSSLNAQLIANCERVWPLNAATSLSLVSLLNISGVSASLVRKGLAEAIRLSAGIVPLRYLPVRRPCSSGEYTISPLPELAVASLTPFWSMVQIGRAHV